MRSIRVTFTDGNVIKTQINGTDEEIRQYYVGQLFNFGDTEAKPGDDLVYGKSVEFLDTDEESN